jgi:hypothetical protein
LDVWFTQNFPFIFPVFFVTLWLVVTGVLALFSGWFALLKAFPDREEEPILRMSGQSGSMGMGVGLRGVLILSACPSGLRIGIMRMFGPFSRPFFVPWREISVIRNSTFLAPVAKLQLGNVGTLSIPANSANRLAHAAGKNWPEAGPIPLEVPRRTASRLLAQWALFTSLASAFFIIAPLIAAPEGEHSPVAVAILFPAIFFGAVFIVRFFRERS